MIEIKNELIKYDIIGLTETWIVNLSKEMENIFEEFYCFFSPAVKTFNKGRASGGLLLLIKRQKSVSVKILYQTEMWIVTEVKVNNDKLIVGVIYFSQQEKFEIYMEKLDSMLAEESF